MRRLLRLLPLGLVAVLLQIGLPTSFTTPVAAAKDVIEHTAFCGAEPAGPASPDAPPPQPAHAMCAFCHQAVWHWMMPPPTIVPMRRPHGVPPRPALWYSASRPRGPPRLLPQARAPP
jgi:hypothetical protein